MVFPVQQSLTVMLSVDVNQNSGRIPQRGHADILSIDPADTPSLHEFSAQSHHTVLRKDIQRFQFLPDPFFIHAECQFHQSGSCSVSQHIRTVSAAQCQAD